MWQHFTSLPLELRNIIYDHVLSDPHDILNFGIPPLYQVHPLITTELYSYRKTITTIFITHKSVYPCHEDAETPRPLIQVALLALVKRFEGNKEMAKGIVLVFKAVHYERQLRPEDKNPRLAALGRMDAVFRSVDATFVESKAMFWSLEFRRQGVETRVDGRGIRTGSGVFR
jgi:hypothetical protein